MLASLFPEEMAPFFDVIYSFPVAIFTVLLGVSIFIWLIALIGLIDLEILDIDLPEPDVELSGSTSNPSVAEAFTGLLLKFGLNGVPLTIIISFVSIIGWGTSYQLDVIAREYFGDGLIHFIVAIPIFIVSAAVAIYLTSIVIKPLRKFFNSLDQESIKRIIGQRAIVRSSVVDKTFGEAILDADGASLLLSVRSVDEQVFKKGDKVVLLEYLKSKGTYRVISEQEFLQHN